ncbi:MAG TPA: DinB family protein [Terriglobales bacterium]|nr:DinB family protein [Terriglobales bacterium]
MNDIPEIIHGLKQSPAIFKNLLTQIPSELLKVRRIPGKWCIHEHACHIATGDQAGFIDRFKQFINEQRPKIKPLSGESFPPDYLIEMDLNEALDIFFEKRKELVNLVNSADTSIWTKEAEHPEYQIYTPYIMLRHRLMHDYFHMYRIEELWLTNKKYLKKA